MHTALLNDSKVDSNAILDNEFCEREVGRPGPYGPQEMVIQAHQAFHFDDTTIHSPSPVGPAGRYPLNFLNLINLGYKWLLHTGILVHTAYA